MCLPVSSQRLHSSYLVSDLEAEDLAAVTGNKENKGPSSVPAWPWYMQGGQEEGKGTEVPLCLSISEHGSC